MCVCEPGWGGALCERPACPSSRDLECSGRGWCSPDSRACVCPLGWRGEACQEPMAAVCPRGCSGRRGRGAPPAARRHVGQKGLDPGLRGVDEAVGRVVHVLRAFRSRGSLLVIYKCSESMGGSLLPVLGRVTWAIGSESMALLRARCLVASGAGSPTSLSTAASYSGRGQRVIGLGRETRGSPPGSEKPDGLTRG